jgi:formate dehydrogenase (coenzyme F420) beta subunit
MIDQIRKAVAELLSLPLSTGEGPGTGVDGVVALKRMSSDVGPHLFQKGDNVSALEVEPHYPLMTLVSRLHKNYPALRVGIVARGCDERAYVEMAKRNQIDPNRLTIIGFACTAEAAQACYCADPAPQHFVVGTRPAPGPVNPVVAKYDSMSLQERGAFWKQQFARCIKCYGCRNICPECFCEACAMEDAAWVEPGLLAPPFPTFHLIRAMHMASRCVACRECERACPAHIPLTVLYDLMRRDMGDLLGYVPGADINVQPPLSLTLEQAPIKSRI